MQMSLHYLLDDPCMLITLNYYRIIMKMESKEVEETIKAINFSYFIIILKVPVH